MKFKILMYNGLAFWGLFTVLTQEHLPPQVDVEPHVVRIPARAEPSLEGESRQMTSPLTRPNSTLSELS